jgi:hypothetical protein
MTHSITGKNTTSATGTISSVQLNVISVAR